MLDCTVAGLACFQRHTVLTVAGHMIGPVGLIDKL